MMDQVEVESSPADEYLTPLAIEQAYPGLLTRMWLEGARRRGDGPPYIRRGSGKNARVFYRRGAVLAWLTEKERANG